MTITIDNVVFFKADLDAADWVQMNDVSCGAFVSDIFGKCHNVQQWYDDASYNLL